MGSPQTRAINDFVSLLSCEIQMMSETGMNQPSRTASEQLPFMMAHSLDSADACCAIPSFQLQQNGHFFTPRSSNPLLEDAVALNLRNPTEIRKIDLSGVPLTLLRNASNAFISLVDSRLRASLTALLRKARDAGAEVDTSLTRMILGLLSASASPISPTKIATSYRTLAFSGRTEDGAYLVPMEMEIVVNLNVLGHSVSIVLEAPGTIQGHFLCGALHEKPTELLKVELQIDTAAILHSMMREARAVVRSAVGWAYEMSRQLLQPPLRRSLSSGDMPFSTSLQPPHSASLMRLSGSLSEFPTAFDLEPHAVFRSASDGDSNGENAIVFAPLASAPKFGQIDEKNAKRSNCAISAESVTATTANVSWGTYRDESTPVLGMPSLSVPATSTPRGASMYTADAEYEALHKRAKMSPVEEGEVDCSEHHGHLELIRKYR
jgi:hypothetical protein